jgi:hypothetical protein
LSADVAGLDVPDEAYAVDLTADPYGLSKVTASFSNSLTVSFDGHGTPTSGGTVVLTAQGHQCTVTLDGLTGQVSITGVETPGDVPAPDGLEDNGVVDVP